MTPPRLTGSAVDLLDGRPVHVRSSRRNGCCGGSAAIPLAEAGAPDHTDDLVRFDVGGTIVYVDPDVRGGPSWTIDTDGFARWRRLVVLGLDVTPVSEPAEQSAQPST